MKLYDVEVFVDEEPVRLYRVWAMSEERARSIACEQVRDLVGAEVVSADEDREDEEFDAVLGAAPFRYPPVGNPGRPE